MEVKCSWCGREMKQGAYAGKGRARRRCWECVNPACPGPPPDEPEDDDDDYYYDNDYGMDAIDANEAIEEARRGRGH